MNNFFDTDTGRIVRESCANDIHAIMDIYLSAREFMARSGNSTQWINGYPSQQLILNDIAAHRSYVVTEGGKVVGVFALFHGLEPTYQTIYNGQWVDNDAPYATIHRLAKAGDVRGIFDCCLRACSHWAANLRADTHARNQTMQRALVRNGFIYRGVVHMSDGSERLAYQQALPQQLCDTLVQYVEQSIIPQYKHFDTAHNTDHAHSVVNRSLAIADKECANINMVYAAAAYHDIGLSQGRATHHLTSAKAVRDDKALLEWFSPLQIETIAQAVEDHRASTKQPPRSIYGAIVAEADRLIEPRLTIRRTVAFGLSHYPALSKEQHWQRTVEHLEEKYSSHGYIKLWLPSSPNKEPLEELRRIIADKETLRTIFEQEYLSLTRADN